MSQLFRSDNDIITEIREKYDYHLSWANKYKAMLDAADGVGLFVNRPKSNAIRVETNREITPSTQSGKKKETFADIIVKYFSDGKPKTTMMVLDLYNKQTKHPLDRKNLSSRLSIMAKLTRQIKNVEYTDASNDTRFWWGLSNWFNGDILMPQYAQHVVITKKSPKLLSLDDL